MSRIILFIPLIMLTACQGLPTKSEDSPYYDIPAGSILVLNETITIPAERTSVYLQNGKILHYSMVDPYYPHCQFDVRTIKDTSQIVSRDKFIIYKVGHWTSAIDNGIKRVGLRILSSGGNGLSPQTYATILYLQSDRQPDVLTMTCQHWEDPVDAEFLTIKQIRRTLGSVFTLELLKESI